MALTILKFLPIAILGLFFLFGGHYFIYRALISVFGVVSSAWKTGLLVFFFLMSAGFFFASFTAHISQSQLIKYFYIITAFWLGLAVNLLLAACLIAILGWLIGLSGLNINGQLVGAAVFLLAVLFSLYGFWSAFHPQVKNLDVKIKNLPLEWQNKKIVQLSDVHLGYVHGVDFLRRVVAKANAQQPDLILITGDLFDGTDGDLNIFAKPLKELKAKEGIFFVTGNHEAYVGLERALAILKQTDIKVLNNEVFEIDGLQIIGLSYSLMGDAGSVTGELKNEMELIKSLKNFNKKKPSILMYHSPVNIEQAAESGINLQLSGHTHDGQLWPFNLVARLIYGRYNYGFSSLGDFSLYTTNGIGTWGPPMRTIKAPEIPVFKLK